MTEAEQRERGGDYVRRIVQRLTHDGLDGKPVYEGGPPLTIGSFMVLCHRVSTEGYGRGVLMTGRWAVPTMDDEYR